MKRILLLIIALALCITMCSCESLLKKAKEAVTGQEESQMPADYITTIEGEQFTYELYEEYIKLIKYTAEETEVVIPSEIDDISVTVIGSLCFYDTKAKVTSVKIPDSIKKIEESAFYYADSLTSIVIPDSVKSLGSRSFAWCNSLQSVTLSANLEEIPEYCFNHCVSLTEIDLSENIKTIGTRAFSYCEALIEISVSQSIAEIGDLAFSSCTALEYASFESETVDLGEKVFDSCEKIVVLASENSMVYNYCAANGLRWSVSKDIEAIVIPNDQNVSAPDETVSE